MSKQAIQSGLFDEPPKEMPLERHQMPQDAAAAISRTPEPVTVPAPQERPEWSASLADYLSWRH